MTPVLETIIWLARIAAALYLLALILIWRKSASSARLAWTAGVVVYLVHVWYAFEYLHHWSHAAALQAVREQTLEIFGVDSGFGLYLNYIFTVVWTVDALWWWLSPSGYTTRPRIVTVAVHAFMAFMYVNATIVTWVVRAIRS